MAKKLIPVLAVYLPGSNIPRVFRGNPLEITTTKSKYHTFINGFSASPVRLAAVAIMDDDNEPAHIVFEERISEQKKQRFWKGRLAPGWASKIGASCIIKITEYHDRERSGRFNLAMDCEVVEYALPGASGMPVESPHLSSLFQ